MTRCRICGLGERVGKHDWKTGWTSIPTKGHPKGHKFEPDLRNDDDHPFGFKDKFVANSHKREKLCG